MLSLLAGSQQSAVNWYYFDLPIIHRAFRDCTMRILEYHDVLKEKKKRLLDGSVLVLYGEQFSAIQGEACDRLPPVAVANSDHCLGDIIHIRVVSDNMHPTQDNVITVGRFFFFVIR